jgi:hypothetical protein
MSTALVELAQNGQPLAAEVVIDSHAHVGPFASYYIPYNAPAEMVHEMDRVGIRCCWAFPFMLACEWRRGNDDVIGAVREFPGRFWGIAAMSPHYPDELLPELERCLEAGCVGVKFHPDLHHYDPNAVDMDSVLSYLDRYGLLCHSHNFGTPETMLRLVKRYPRVTFVSSHFSPGYDRVVNECTNLFVCACTCWGMRSLEEFVERVGAERVLFASDFPCLDLATALGPVLFAQLSDEQKRMILGLNAEKIMKRVNANVLAWRATAGKT